MGEPGGRHLCCPLGWPSWGKQPARRGQWEPATGSTRHWAEATSSRAHTAFQHSVQGQACTLATWPLRLACFPRLCPPQAVWRERGDCGLRWPVHRHLAVAAVPGTCAAHARLPAMRELGARAGLGKKHSSAPCGACWEQRRPEASGAAREPALRAAARSALIYAPSAVPRRPSLTSSMRARGPAPSTCAPPSGRPSPPASPSRRPTLTRPCRWAAGPAGCAL